MHGSWNLPVATSYCNTYTVLYCRGRLLTSSIRDCRYLCMNWRHDYCFFLPNRLKKFATLRQFKGLIDCGGLVLDCFYISCLNLLFTVNSWLLDCLNDWFLICFINLIKWLKAEVFVRVVFPDCVTAKIVYSSKILRSSITNQKYDFYHMSFRLKNGLVAGPGFTFFRSSF